MTRHLALEGPLRESPATWSRRRLKNTVERTDQRRGDGDAPLLSLSSSGRLYAREGIGDRQQASEEGQTRCLICNPGDLVVNPMWLTGGAIAVSDKFGAVSPDYRVFRPSSDVHPRFLHHLLRAEPYMAQYRLFVRADTTFDRRIQQPDLDGMPIALPPLDEQRRIAEFLDDQTMRIENIIAAREQQLAALKAETQSRADELMSPWVDMAPRVKHVTSKIGSGKTPTGGADAYVDSGVMFLRSQNVHNEGLRLDDVAYIDSKTDAEMSATRVRAGDVLLNITGASLGRCTHVGPGLAAANVSQHVCILRPLAHVDPLVLAYGIATAFVQEQIGLSQVGGNREGLNFEQGGLLRVPIPLESATQLRLRAEIEESAQSRAGALELLRRSVVLLREFHQSLTVGAVTGRLTMPTHPGQGMPA